MNQTARNKANRRKRRAKRARRRKRVAKMTIKPGYNRFLEHEVCSRHCPAYKARTGRCAVNTDRVELYAPCVPALVYHRTGGKRPALLVIEGQP